MAKVKYKLYWFYIDVFFRKLSLWYTVNLKMPLSAYMGTVNRLEIKFRLFYELVETAIFV